MGCDDTIMAFCVSPDNSRDILDALCRNGYTEQRETECRDNGSAEDGEEGKPCATIKEAFCGGGENDTPFAPVCGANANNKITFCKIGNNSLKDDCTNNIMAICHVQTGDPFNAVCPDNPDNDADRKTRAEACLDPNNDKVCSAEVTQCNAAPFGEKPLGGDCEQNIYAKARMVFCTEGDDIFDGQCEDVTHGEVDAARLLACKGAIENLPANALADACNDADLSGVICGNATTIGELPFAEICSDMNRNINYAVYIDAQRNFCRTTGEIDREECRDTVSNFCGVVGTANVDTLFNDLCRGAAYTPERETECRKDIDNGLCGDTITDFCGQVGSATVGNLFNDLCLGTDYTEERETECRKDIDNGDCTATIANFCDNAPDANLFDDLCNKGYTDARVVACQATNSTTGVYVNCGDIINTNCTVGNSPACAPTTGTTPASFWADAARNKDNDGTLIVLDEVQQDDADTNYVQGDATGLNLGFAEAVGVETVLKITDLDNLNDGDVAGGVAFVRIEFADFTSANKVKYYAGLLSDTDLGAPFGAPLGGSTPNAIWNASFSAIVNGVVETDPETSIVIDFDINSLTTDDNEPVTLSNSAGSIVIAGEFTDAGVIYGTSSWTVGQDSSEGTVTGLIGAKGAVGAFVSSGGNTDEVYAGGFVAAPVDCSEDGTLFHRLCVSNDGVRDTFCGRGQNSFDPRCDSRVLPQQKTMFAETCRMAPLTAGCDRVIVEAGNITINNCTNTTDNHPHQTGCEDAVFADQRELRIADCLINGATAECMRGEVTAITTPCDINPYDTICDTYAEEYATKRSERTMKCRDDTLQAGLDCSGTVVCAADETPVSLACGADDGIENAPIAEPSVA